MTRGLRRARPSRWARALLLALAVGALPSCSGRDSAPLPTEGVPGAELPGEAPTWLAPLQRAHQLADSATTPVLRQDALTAFDRALTSLPAASSAGFTAGQIWIRQDALARTAELELELGHPDRAVLRADRALELGSAASVPVATLHTVRGRAFEASGDTEGAVGAYHAALIVNQQLMERALDTSESGGP